MGFGAGLGFPTSLSETNYYQDYAGNVVVNDNGDNISPIGCNQYLRAVCGSGASFDMTMDADVYVGVVTVNFWSQGPARATVTHNGTVDKKFTSVGQQNTDGSWYRTGYGFIEDQLMGVSVWNSNVSQGWPDNYAYWNAVNSSMNTSGVTGNLAYSGAIGVYDSTTEEFGAHAHTRRCLFGGTWDITAGTTNSCTDNPSGYDDHIITITANSGDPFGYDDTDAPYMRTMVVPKPTSARYVDVRAESPYALHTYTNMSCVHELKSRPAGVPGSNCNTIIDVPGCTTSDGSKFVAIPNTASNLGIETGMYVFGPGIEETTRVEAIDVDGTNVIKLDTAATDSIDIDIANVNATRKTYDTPVGEGTELCFSKGIIYVTSDHYPRYANSVVIYANFDFDPYNSRPDLCTVCGTNANAFATNSNTQDGVHVRLHSWIFTSKVGAKYSSQTVLPIRITHPIFNSVQNNFSGATVKVTKQITISDKSIVTNVGSC